MTSTRTTSTSTPTKESYKHLRHIPELDGLRGLAALVVFVHHACYATLSISAAANWPHYIATLSDLSALGERGVDLFFVLSGFLITSVLIKDRGNPRYYQEFYWKRAIRILPLYVVCLIGCALFMHQLAYVALSAVFLVNFAAQFHITGVGPFWTLAIEEQFYLLWPSVLRRKTVSQVQSWALALGVSAVLLRVLFALHGNHNYRLTPLRCDGLAFGAVLACQFTLHGQNAKKMWDLNVSLGFLLALGLILSFAGYLPLSQVMVHMLTQTGTVLVTGPVVGFAIFHSGAPMLSVFRKGVLPFFGLISYAFYMVHLYVIAAYDHLQGVPQAGDVHAYWNRFLLTFAASILLSLLSRKIIELPAMKMRKYVLKHPNLQAERESPPLPLAPM